MATAFLNKTPNDWLKQIMSCGRIEEIPPGWLTLAQMCKETGLNERTMRTRVNGLVFSGKLQRRQFRIDIGKDVRPVWHYAPTQTSKSR